ncbi:hypothetical protein FRC03_008086 [Tulasnella sp. 419]|nr:hypothetical protein FRC02_010400 [Tulasnella sp. 418]KAG8959356.1 hypothetical protein FRC03_008086 [Tulasnella sp. 419]
MAQTVSETRLSAAHYLDLAIPTANIEWGTWRYSKLSRLSNVDTQNPRDHRSTISLPASPTPVNESFGDVNGEANGVIFELPSPDSDKASSSEDEPTSYFNYALVSTTDKSRKSVFFVESGLKDVLKGKDLGLSQEFKSKAAKRNSVLVSFAPPTVELYPIQSDTSSSSSSSRRSSTSSPPSRRHSRLVERRLSRLPASTTHDETAMYYSAVRAPTYMLSNDSSDILTTIPPRSRRQGSSGRSPTQHPKALGGFKSVLKKATTHTVRSVKKINLPGLGVKKTRKDLKRESVVWDGFVRVPIEEMGIIDLNEADKPGAGIWWHG